MTAITEKLHRAFLRPLGVRSRLGLAMFPNAKVPKRAANDDGLVWLVLAGGVALFVLFGSGSGS